MRGEQDSRQWRGLEGAVIGASGQRDSSLGRARELEIRGEKDAFSSFEKVLKKLREKKRGDIENSK